ncbi:aryl hydrocarbon receptor [Caerostris extrusa]|uniref:Aryl hydrocarbon receptor n=1 Tax=Caerostris extrusa TaxID=172846 RepID=A0AAV4R3D6_CAEEX|nr:aryl hydrocarbon receptor [Caerostris extrusa]
MYKYNIVFNGKRKYNNVVSLAENSHLLERNFTVRFRCLLDNTSGFLRLDIRGRIKILHGQNHKTEEPPLALFAVCTPFDRPPLCWRCPTRTPCSKANTNSISSLVSLDQREEEGRDLLGKRTMDFKVTYLDGGLNSTADRSSLMSDSDFVLRCQRTRRYKSQIRDIINTCRKRKSPVNGPVTATTIVSSTEPATYMDDAAVVAAAGYNNVYPSIGTYYPDYAVTQYPSNGFLDASAARTCFTAGAFQPDPNLATKEDKLYQCQIEAAKFGDSSSSPQQIKTPTTSSCCDTTSYLSMNGVDPLRGCLVNNNNSAVQPLVAGSPRHQSAGPGLLQQPKLLAPHKYRLHQFGTGFKQSDQKPSERWHGHQQHPHGHTRPAALAQRRKVDPLRQSAECAHVEQHRNQGQSLGGVPGHQQRRSADLRREAARYCDPVGGKEMEIGNVNGSPCKWSGHAAAPKSASPHNSTSPASGKVAPQVTYSSTPYTQDMRLELPLVRSDIIRPSSVKQEGNPLLSISEVTNTLLDHH